MKRVWKIVFTIVTALLLLPSYTESRNSESGSALDLTDKQTTLSPKTNSKKEGIDSDQLFIFTDSSMTYNGRPFMPGMTIEEMCEIFGPYNRQPREGLFVWDSCGLRMITRSLKYLESTSDLAKIGEQDADTEEEIISEEEEIISDKLCKAMIGALFSEHDLDLETINNKNIVYGILIDWFDKPALEEEAHHDNMRRMDGYRKRIEIIERLYKDELMKYFNMSEDDWTAYCNNSYYSAYMEMGLPVDDGQNKFPLHFFQGDLMIDGVVLNTETVLEQKIFDNFPELPSLTFYGIPAYGACCELDQWDYMKTPIKSGDYYTYYLDMHELPTSFYGSYVYSFGIFLCESDDWSLFSLSEKKKPYLTDEYEALYTDDILYSFSLKKQ